MTSRKLGRRAQKTKQEIFHAAMELFAEHGVANVSMQDIADKAETARSTVFNHYPQKHALLSEFFLSSANSIVDKMASQEPREFRAGMEFLFDAIQKEVSKSERVYREIAKMALGDGPLAAEEAAIDKKMLKIISGFLESGIESDEVDKNINTVEVAKLILCIITQTNHDAINHDRVKHLAKDHKRRFNILYQGFAQKSQKQTAKNGRQKNR